MESHLSATLPDTVLAAAGIDVGFFATKFTCYRQSSPGKAGAIVADQFPSIAPRQTGMSIALPNTDKADLVEIEIEPNVSQEGLPEFREVMVLDQNPVTSNVRGFHVWAEQFNAANKVGA